MNNTQGLLIMADPECRGVYSCNQCRHKESFPCPGGTPVHDEQDQDHETRGHDERRASSTILRFLSGVSPDYRTRQGD